MDNLPAWWDRDKWRERIVKDPRQKAILLFKIFEYALMNLIDDWDMAKINIEKGIRSKKIKSMYPIGSVIKKEIGRLK